MPTLLLFALLFVSTVPTASVPAPAPALDGTPPIAFVDVRVVTLGPAGTLENATVVVQGDRITAVGPSHEIAIPEGAQRIPGRGFTLIPGLIDLHVHVGDEVDLDLYVAQGVTTVRTLNGSLWHLGLRDRVDAGARLGPSMHVSGPPVTGVETAEQAQAVVADQASRGFGSLKIYGDITPEAYAALVRSAREHGMRPIGHIPRNLRLEDVLRTPPDSIDHAEEFLYSWFDKGHGLDSIPELTRLMQQSGTAVVATLTCYDHIGRQVASFDRAFHGEAVRYASAYNWRNWSAGRNQYKKFAPDDVPNLRNALVVQKAFLKAFHSAGIPVLLGTDSGSEGVPFVMPGFSAHDELVHLTDCGLSAEQALAAGTREAARFLGVLDEVGTIEPGKRADMLLIMGDPLSDIRNTTLQAGVMVRGRWMSLEELDALLGHIERQSRDEAAFMQRLAKGGVAAGTTFYETCTADDPQRIPFREDTVNELGYEAMIVDDDLDLAAEFFKLNTRAYPGSWNAYDSLGEALRAQGQLEEALEAFAEAVRLEPRHVDGERCVVELREELGDAR